MDESLKVFAKQLGKNAEKQPGWIYLLVAIYLALYAFGVPSQLDIAGWRLTVPKLSAEIWATLLALVLYQVGDALDKVTFKKRNKEGKWVDRFQPETFKDAIKAARDKFGVNDGIYDVSMKILEKAKQAKFSVHFLNEMAKFFRSLIAPGLAIAIVLSLQLTIPWALLLLALALLCTYVLAVQVYPRFKNLTGSIFIGRWWHCQPKIWRRSPARSLGPYACSSGKGLSWPRPQSRLTPGSTRTRSKRAPPARRAPVSANVRSRS